MKIPGQRGPRAKPLQLTESQQSQLRSIVHSSQPSRSHMRALALLALHRGERVEHVAKFLSVSKQSVINWRKAWLKKKNMTVISDGIRCGRPREWDDERQDLLEALLERPPADFGYRSMSWTSHLLSNYLEQVTGWKPSDRSIRLELKNLGYVYKRPRYVLEPDPQLLKKSR